MVPLTTGPSFVPGSTLLPTSGQNPNEVVNFHPSPMNPSEKEVSSFRLFTTKPFSSGKEISVRAQKFENGFVDCNSHSLLEILRKRRSSHTRKRWSTTFLLRNRVNFYIFEKGYVKLIIPFL